MTQVVDTRGLKRRLSATSKAIERAQKRARRDAGKQVLTRVKRDVAKEINLRKSDIAKDMKVVASTDFTQFRVLYEKKPAHHFLGYKYRAVAAGEALTLVGGRRVTFGRVRQQFLDQAGLTVTFRKQDGPMRFRNAFLTPQVGHGRVFIQRKYREQRPQYKHGHPLVAIMGPTPHGYALDSIGVYSEFASNKLAQRFDYWRDRELAKLGSSF